MISVLIITHGLVGQELLKAAESIVGKQAAVRVLGLDASEGPAAFALKIRVALEEMNSPAGILVLSDMMGGTPSNAALRMSVEARVHYEIVTGINLPMLISGLTNRHYMPLEQLAQKLVDDAPRNTQRPLLRLRESMKEEAH